MPSEHRRDVRISLDLPDKHFDPQSTITNKTRIRLDEQKKYLFHSKTVSGSCFKFCLQK